VLFFNDKNISHNAYVWQIPWLWINSKKPDIVLTYETNLVECERYTRRGEERLC